MSTLEHACSFPGLLIDVILLRKTWIRGSHCLGVTRHQQIRAPRHKVMAYFHEQILAGVPELHFGFEQVKPPWLMAVGAVALLASNKTVTGGRTFGKTQVQLPVAHTNSLAQACSLSFPLKPST